MSFPAQLRCAVTVNGHIMPKHLHLSVFQMMTNMRTGNRTFAYAGCKRCHRTRSRSPTSPGNAWAPDHPPAHQRDLTAGDQPQAPATSPKHHPNSATHSTSSTSESIKVRLAPDSLSHPRRPLPGFIRNGGRRRVILRRWRSPRRPPTVTPDGCR